MKRFLIIVFFLNLGILAQEVPPITNFKAETYNASNQNWAISQALNKKICVANNASLLVYNGASWQSYPSPNESIIRSVNVIGNRIYTGCFMEFGYWEANTLGVLNYTSLSNKIKRKLKEDEQFWNIYNIGKWMVFQSLNCIYIYDTHTKKFEIICSDDTIVKSFKIKDVIYYQKNKKGLFKIELGNEVIVSVDEVLKSNRIVSIFTKFDKLIILTEHSGFYYLENGQLSKSNLLSKSQISQYSFYSGIQLRNNDFALGTISNGFLCMSPEGEIKFQINQDSGLQNNTVLSLYEDQSNNIWLGLDNGISFINPNSAYKIYNDTEGILGSVYAAKAYREYLYLGTNQGLFFKKLNTTDTFQLIPGTKGQVWSLNVINNTLFCGHNSGTFIVTKNNASQIADVPGTWTIKALDSNSSILIQGNYNGLYVLNFDQNRWKIRNKISGFDYSSRYFEVFQNQIFVNHEYKGVFKLKVNKSFKKVEKVSIDTLIKGANSSIIKYNDDLLYAYKNGVLKYNNKKKIFVKHSLLSASYNTNTYDSGKLIVAPEENALWIFSKSKISKIEPSIINNLKISDIAIDNRKRNSVLGYENIVKLNQRGDYLMGTLSGYIIFNEAQLSNTSFNVFIEKIEVKGSDTIFLNDKNLEGNFKTKENNIDFSFFVPNYNGYLDTYYQFQLQGIYNQWSALTKEPSVKFENLPHGNYRFNVRAKIGNSYSKNTASYQFSIQKPWYITTPMIVVYMLSVFLFSLLMHLLYRKYYKRQQQRLLSKTKKELAFTKIQNEKALIKVQNEQLELENKSKTKELAASTMGMIRKNEVLSNIKKELNKVADKKSVKSVIQLIDENLKQNNDWLLFQEAFNNTDSDFLKNIKKLHPSLTPNDLKLCVYLRLNLSSKEIAQLFHISPRSVEIKRYRLRKKLNLKHEDNLVNYILDL